jgi:hypothetical protein
MVAPYDKSRALAIMVRGQVVRVELASGLPREIRLDRDEIPIEVSEPSLQDLKHDAQVYAPVKVHDSIAEARHASQVLRQSGIDDSRLFDEIEGFGIRSGRAEIVSGANVCRNLDGRLDCQLQCVEHRVLPFAIRKKVRFRYACERAKIFDVPADVALAVADNLGVGTHQRCAKIARR